MITDISQKSIFNRWFLRYQRDTELETIIIEFLLWKMKLEVMLKMKIFTFQILNNVIIKSIIPLFF